MEDLKFMIPCLMGLEKIVADELKRLNMREVRASNGHVTCVGGMADIPRLNLWLRCGARVLLVLAEFDARTFEELFQGVKAIDWEDWIAQDGEFPVKGYSISSQLHSVPACQSIVKKAVSQHLSEQYGMEWLPETGCRYPDPVLHSEGSRHRGAGHFRRGALQAGLSGRGRGGSPAGDAGGRAGQPVPLQGAGSRSGTPSAAAAPSPSRPLSSPKTVPRA